jgi:hypothetical protein
VERPAGVRFLHSPDTSVIAHVRPAVAFGIGVENFAVVPAGGNADPVVLADNRREVTDDDDRVAGVSAAA